MRLSDRSTAIRVGFEPTVTVVTSESVASSRTFTTPGAPLTARYARCVSGLTAAATAAYGRVPSVYWRPSMVVSVLPEMLAANTRDVSGFTAMVLENAPTASGADATSVVPSMTVTVPLVWLTTYTWLRTASMEMPTGFEPTVTLVFVLSAPLMMVTALALPLA